MVSGGVVVSVGPTSVVGLDVATGVVRWRIDRARGTLVPAAIDADAGGSGVVVFSEGTTEADSALVGVDLVDQEERWRVALDAPSRTAPTVEAGVVYVGTHDGTLLAVAVESGEEQWRFEAGGRVDTPAAVADGHVYVVAEDFDEGVARLHAVDAESGKETWAYTGAVGSIRVSAPTVADDKVIAGFGDFTVRAFAADDGRLLWDERVRSVFSPLSAPAVAGGDVYAADRSGSLYRLDGSSGDQEWDHQVPADNIRGSPLVVGGYAYLGFEDGTLAAFDVGTGDLRWRVGLPGPVGALAPAADLLLAPTVGVTGGLIAYAHAADRPLVRMRSPTILRLGPALLSFAAAASVLLVALPLLFGFLARARGRGPLTGRPSRGRRRLGGR